MTTASNGATKAGNGVSNAAFDNKPMPYEIKPKPTGAELSPKKTVADHDRSVSYTTQFPSMAANPPDRSPSGRSRISSGSVYTVTAC